MRYLGHNYIIKICDSCEKSPFGRIKRQSTG